MKKNLRPILLITLVSFLLGLWLSLRNAEQNLMQALREAPTLRILTDQPAWWQSLAERAESQGIAKLEILHPSRGNWEDILKHKEATCDLVTFKSYFLRHFANNNWLEATSSGQAWWELLHPDFQQTSFDLKPGQYLPLLWGVAIWNNTQPAAKEGRLELKTSLDEALLTAIDMHESTDDFNEAEHIDNQETAEQLWNFAKENLNLSFDQPAAFIPLTPIKAVQRFVTEASDIEDSTPKTNFQDLWTWGFGVCPGKTHSQVLQDFVLWLMEAENLSVLANQAHLAMTTMSADHHQKSWRPSNLRGFKLETLRRRELSWDLSSAWEDLLKPRQESPANR